MKINENETRLKGRGQVLAATDPKHLNFAMECNPEAGDAIPRLLLHIQDGAKVELAENLQKKFRNKGYLVPNIQVVGKVPENTELRYCAGKMKDSDIVEINELLATEGVALSEPKAINTFGCKNVFNKWTYELWLKNDPIVQQ